MTLIKAFNSFMSAAGKDRLSPHEVTLYMAIMHKWNMLHRKPDIAMTNDEIKDKTGMDLRTIRKARERLVDCGYITYKRGDRGVASVYNLIDKD